MKTYKISDISIYPFNENGKKFVEEIRYCLNTNEKLTERINNIFDNGCHSHFHDVSNNGCEKIGGCIINYRKILKRYVFKSHDRWQECYSINKTSIRKNYSGVTEIEKRKNEVIKTFEKRINKATKEKDVKLAILGAGLLSDNYIYYVEGNNVVFNYYSYHDKVTEEEYNNMLKNIDYSLLPEGIKFEFK